MDVATFENWQKLGFQDNSAPQRSAVGESTLRFNNDPGGYAQGQDAWKSVSRFMKQPPKDDPNPFQGKHASDDITFPEMDKEAIGALLRAGAKGGKMLGGLGKKLFGRAGGSSASHLTNPSAHKMPGLASKAWKGLNKQREMPKLPKPSMPEGLKELYGGLWPEAQNAIKGVGGLGAVGGGVTALGLAPHAAISGMQGADEMLSNTVAPFFGVTQEQRHNQMRDGYRPTGMKPWEGNLEAFDTDPIYEAHQDVKQIHPYNKVDPTEADWERWREYEANNPDYAAAMGKEGTEKDAGIGGLFRTASKMIPFAGKALSGAGRGMGQVARGAQQAVGKVAPSMSASRAPASAAGKAQNALFQTTGFGGHVPGAMSSTPGGAFNFGQRATQGLPTYLRSRGLPASMKRMMTGGAVAGGVDQMAGGPVAGAVQNYMGGGQPQQPQPQQQQAQSPYGMPNPGQQARDLALKQGEEVKIPTFTEFLGMKAAAIL